MWQLVIFPKGQYVHNDESAVIDSGKVSLYVQMVECENENHTLNLTINASIKSPYCDVENIASPTKVAQFSCGNPTESWTGPIHLSSAETLYSQDNKIFFFKDSLTVECSLEQKSKILKRKSSEDKVNHFEVKKRVAADTSLIDIMPLLNEYKGINELHGEEPCYVPLLSSKFIVLFSLNFRVAISVFTVCKRYIT